jgi:dTMP kinase
LGVDLEVIERCYAMSVGDFAPDLTVILDLEPEAGIRRTQARTGVENRYEQMDIAFHRRLRSGFLEIAQRERNRCAVVSAADSVEQVQSLILSIVEARFGGDARGR